MNGESIADCSGFILNQDIPHKTPQSETLLCFVSPDSLAGRNLLIRLDGRPYELLKTASPLPRSFAKASPDAQEASVYRLIDGLAGAGGEFPVRPRIGPVLDYIAAHLTEPLTPELLGMQIHLSGERLRHLFQESTGITLTQYILWERIRAVLHAITGGDTFFASTHHFGFADHSHFSRIFRRIFGIPPGVMMAECRLITI